MNDDEPTRDDRDDVNPLAELMRQLGFDGLDAPDMPTLFSNLEQFVNRMGSRAESGVRWPQVKDTIRKLVSAAGPDPFINIDSNREQAEALRLSGNWLDEAGVMPDVELSPQLWSRAEWIERTFDGWQTVVAPIADRLGHAMMTSFAEQGDGFPPEFAGLRATLSQMMRSASSMMYAEQVARAIAQVATGVVSASDLGLPLASENTAALLPTNVAEFCTDLAQPERDVTIYLALRESARMRLFSKAAWLPGALLVLVKHYAEEISIDTDAVGSVMDPRELANLSPTELQQASESLFGKLFRPASTPEQRDVLERIEVLVALIEGWVDAVVGAAASKWMPNTEALSEVVRRRRAAGGPGERALQALVGLTLTRRRVQQATELWIRLGAELGPVERDALWQHPDLLPTAQDLGAPEVFLSGEANAPDSLDEELRRLLEQGE